MSSASASKRVLKRSQIEAAGPGPVIALVCLTLFAVMVALLGGSSRFDIVQNGALRPFSALFLIPALYWYSKSKIEGMQAPLVLLALAALWTAIQLIPLPPAIWHLLPGREAIVELDTLHGLEGRWRPISFVPMRGFNALAAMVVPIAAGLLALALMPKSRAILMIIAGIGAFDALLGLAQILGDPEGPLYFYAITNKGAPVGLFANENHSGVFSAVTLLIIARLGLSGGKRSHAAATNIALATAFLIVTLAVLISGSRAALGLGVVAYIAVALMAWLWLKRPDLDGDARGPGALLVRYPRASIVVGLVLAGGLLIALMQFERAPGVVDAFNQNAFEDLRWRIGSILAGLMATHWLVGIGFGSWDAVYQIYEPTGFMGPAYVNQAHNDWAQFVIEGGVPAILLLLAFLRWGVFNLRKIFAESPTALGHCVFWLAISAIVAAASLVDYPLRAPIFQMVVMWLAIVFALDARDSKASSPSN